MNIKKYEKLPKTFYTRDNVVSIARDLIGKLLVTDHNGIITVGRIVETEAYNGRKDKACHAFLKRTKRTEVMYKAGGIAYVYLCYGIHHLFNIVTNKEGYADAVLIRALEPLKGIEIMKSRRNLENVKFLTSGPGKLSSAMRIRKEDTGTDLTGNYIWIGSDAIQENPENIEVDRRINVDYAEEDALLPWRFFIKNSPFVSKKKQKHVDFNRFTNQGSETLD